MPISIGGNTNINTQPLTIDDELPGTILTIDTGTAESYTTSFGGTASSANEFTSVLDQIDTTSAVEELSGTANTGTLSTDAKSLPDIAIETIKVSSVNDVSDILIERGIDQNQPEFLATLQFIPGYSESGKTTCAEMIDVQYFLRNLKADDAATIIATLEENEDLAKSLQSLRDNYVLVTDQISSRLSVLGSILTELLGVKDALDIKDSAAIQPEVTAIRSARGSQIVRDGEIVTLTTPPLGSYSSLHDNITCHLKFSDQAYEAFSNSKIFAQIVTDLQIGCESYTPQLLSVFNSERQEDRDPLLLRTKPTENDTFDFTPSDLSSEAQLGLLTGNLTTLTGFDPGSSSTFNQIVENLPADEISRIKLLTAVLSRELRMSAGIGRMVGHDLDTKYGVENLGLLGRLFGNIGQSALGNGGTEKTLASILRFDGGTAGVVLPFERRTVIDTNSGKTYVPGSVYLVDTILRSNSRPDIAPMEEYSNVVKTTISDTMSALGYLLNFDDAKESLHFSSVIDLFYSQIAQRIQSMGGDQSVNTSDAIKKSAALSFSLLTAGQTDLTLKHLLYKLIREMRTGKLNTRIVTDASDDTSGDDSGGSGNDNIILNENRDVNLPALDSLTDTSLDVLGLETTADQSNLRRKGANPIITGAASTLSTLDPTSTEAFFGLTSLPYDIESRVNTLYGGKTFKQNTVLTTIPMGWQVAYTPGEIESILNNVIDDDYSIFTTIIALADQLTQQALELSSQGPNVNTATATYKTTSGFTRANRFSDDTLLFLVFEIVSSITSEFIISYFDKGQSTSSEIVVTVNSDQNLSVSSKMKSLIGETQTFTVLPSYLTITSLLDSIRSTLIHEDSLLRDLSDVIRAIGNVITSKMDATAYFFNTRGLSVNASIFEELFEDPDNVDILKNLSEQQMNLAWQGTQTILKSNDVSLIPDDQIVSVSQKNALDSMLREPKFMIGRGENLHILTLGMPAGTLESLQNPPFTVNVDTSLESETADLVTISVYKRDPRYADIAFKPQKFVFDISRFAQIENVPSNTSFTAVLDAVKLINVTRLGVGSPESQADVRTHFEYAIMSTTQIDQMFENHIQDALLKIYTKILTGMNFSEHYFMVNEQLVWGNQIDQDVADTINGIIEVGEESTSILGGTLNATPIFGELIGRKTITDILSMPASSLFDIPPHEEPPADLTAQYQTVLNSLLFRSSDQRYRIEQPKIFERIFSLAIDPDDFVIDEELTNSTTYGAAALNSHVVQSAIVEEVIGGATTKKLPASPGGSTLCEYFAVVELGVTL